MAVILLLAACQSAAPETRQSAITITLASTNVLETPAASTPAGTFPSKPSPTSLQISSTPVLAEGDTEIETAKTMIIPPTEPPPVHDSTPIKFTFPTPAAAPVSQWRPPLYEVPWSPGPYDHFYFVRPIAVDEINWPLADYRYGGSFFGPAVVHTGIDIDAPKGTPILAAAPGKVTWAGNGLYFGIYNPDDPYGNAVVIKHDFGYQNYPLYTVYAHMDRVDVILGQRVETGDQLGLVGDTGFTTGPHLHFEIRIGKNSFYVTRNPELWIAPPQGWGILVGRLVDEKGGQIEELEVTVRSKEDSRVWKVKTYNLPGVNSDDYYQENLALSDLPAGSYELEFTFKDDIYTHDFTVDPGRITYFYFSARTGFKTTLPDPQNQPDWLSDSPENN